jgi:transaldolase
MTVSLMPASERIDALRAAGVSIWLDTLSRELVDSGELERLVRERGVAGATSNPTIFAKAITGSDAYDDQLRAEAAAGVADPRELFFTLALDDVRRAAAILQPVHERTGGEDGFVSFEVTPDVAHDAATTVEQGLALRRRLDTPNTMIKVPATAAGIDAIEELTARGVNVNVTLLFSLSRYEQAHEAYLRGLERRTAEGVPLDGIRSVASFFVSRVDVKVDARLPERSPLRGRAAITNARLALAEHRAVLRSERWARLERLGAHPQRPLWASTGTKDPAYPDTMYVAGLAAPGTVNTMPLKTLEAFADHGAPGPLEGEGQACGVVARLAALGIDLEQVGAELEAEGVDAFSDSYAELLASIAGKLPEARLAA